MTDTHIQYITLNGSTRTVPVASLGLFRDEANENFLVWNVFDSEDDQCEIYKSMYETLRTLVMGNS